MNPAIVVNAFNRPKSLIRLLNSIKAAHYPENAAIPLVISLDDSVNQSEVADVACKFIWEHGSKDVLRRDALGLKAHFYACGDLVEKFGAIIYLEDDLLLSPDYYHFATQALNFYSDDERVGGISLYSLWFNGYNRLPFMPYVDGTDVFFLQLPYTQGQAFSAAQWRSFRDWLEIAPNERKVLKPLHESWANFNPDEWFPEWTAYLVSSGLYFVFPRESLSTGMGDAGAHFDRASDFFQVPMVNGRQSLRLIPLKDSAAVYDSFFEMQPACLNRLTDQLCSYNYCVDLYASRTKANISTDYVLTTRRSIQPIYSFAKSLRPMEANLIEGISGDGIWFCKTDSLRWDWFSDFITQENNRMYFSRGTTPGLRAWIRAKFASLLNAYLYLTKRFNK